MMVILKDNSTMDKTEAQIVSYGILYLNRAVGATESLAATLMLMT